MWPGLVILLLVGVLCVFIARLEWEWTWLLILVVPLSGSLLGGSLLYKWMLDAVPYAGGLGEFLIGLVAFVVVVVLAYYIGYWSFGSGANLQSNPWLSALEFVWAYMGTTLLAAYAGHYLVNVMPDLPIPGIIFLMVVVYIVVVIVNLIAAWIADPNDM